MVRGREKERLGVPMHPICSRLYRLHDLVMIKDKEGTDDDDDDADSIVDCRGSAGDRGRQGRGRTEVLFRQQLVLLEDGAIVEHGLLFEGLDLAGCRAGRPACTAIAGDGVVGGAQVAWHDEGRS